MGRRWYQNVAMEGVMFEDPGRKGSRFWNVGKWDNFIKPLLPRERGIFMEIGCNAGLFLKLASDAGFQRVIGVEPNKRILAQAKAYREHVGGDWTLIRQKVGGNLVPEKLPLADVVLLSNVHYYFPIDVFSDLVDHLKSRTLRCIVVAARARRRKGRAFYYLSSVRGYFRDWKEVGVIDGLDDEGDPAPRKRMYGIAFKGNLDAWDLATIYGQYTKHAMSSAEFRRHALSPALEEFFALVLSGQSFELENTLLYQYWKTRGRALPAIRKTLEYKKGLAEDIRDNGMRTPIYYDSQGKLLDGIHRMVIAKQLGYQHILVRRL